MLCYQVGDCRLTLFNWELLQPNNDVISGCIPPCIFWHQCSPDLLKFAVIEYAFRTSFNVDCVASINENFGSCRREGRAVFESLAH